MGTLELMQGWALIALRQTPTPALLNPIFPTIPAWIKSYELAQNLPPGAANFLKFTYLGYHMNLRLADLFYSHQGQILLH